MRIKTIPQWFAVWVIAVYAITSCDSTNSNSENHNFTLIASESNDAVTIELMAPNALTTGYNQLFWKITENDRPVDVQSFTIRPVMHMTEMSHSTPFDQPTPSAEFNGYYSNMAIFIMPSGAMGSWEIGYELITADERILSDTLDVSVASSWRLSSVRDEQNKPYFITWFAPEDPATGNQELSFMVHTRESMMNFPAVNSATLEVYPFMDMGGGEGHSTPYETPVSVGNGKYTGSINYSMSGTWTTDVTLSVDGETLSPVVFEYSVKAR